ncbi:probable protein phosphatase 2C 43 [Trifolium pratense]|uniref:probable protein phosphatase 2C 43 n=1 Tax=Trifolium pratense TaxID=57577 RepID=UPI001E694CA8|nr:probable protein phosphatase 2C 43 [Trifolium pratense]
MLPFVKHVLFGTPYQQYGQIEDPQAFANDPLAWSRPLVRYYSGEFSMAAVQANRDMEDQSQVEVGFDALFVGIYDGHKGDATAIYLKDHIFRELIRLIKENNNNMNKNIMTQVVDQMEKGFMESAGRNVFVSSGCLICFIRRGTLYAANVGDSRAVLGSMKGVGKLKRLVVKQIVKDHNLDHREVQSAIRDLQPDFRDIDYNINFRTCMMIAEKGLIETTRCIGYAYLKEEINESESFEIPSWERVPGNFTRPLLTSQPHVYSRILRDSDKFIIFGSSGFWKGISNEDAAKVVNTSPREGIAERLATLVLQKGAKHGRRTYSQLIGLPKSDQISGSDTRRENYFLFRSAYHLDTTVVVVYLDNNRSNRAGMMLEMNSYRGCDDGFQQSEFTNFYSNANA